MQVGLRDNPGIGHIHYVRILNINTTIINITRIAITITSICGLLLPLHQYYMWDKVLASNMLFIRRILLFVVFCEHCTPLKPEMKD